MGCKKGLKSGIIVITVLVVAVLATMTTNVQASNNCAEKPLLGELLCGGADAA